MESESVRYLDEMIRQYTRFRHRPREFRAITWRSRELESNERGSVVPRYMCVCVCMCVWSQMANFLVSDDDRVRHDLPR